MAFIVSAAYKSSTLTACAPTQGRPAALPYGGVASEKRVRQHFLHRGHGAEFEMEAQWVRSFLPDESVPALEIGCGNGALFEVIGLHRVLGLDHCAEGLALTRGRFPSVPLICGDACDLPLADESVGVVVAQHVIEHLPSYDTACREWLRVLRPGGMLLLLTPNAVFCDPSVFHDETHLHIFNQRDLRAALCQAGFDVVELRTLGLPWFRCYQTIPSGWRLRQFVTRQAQVLSSVSPWCWQGQTLCCTARRKER